MSAFVIFFLVLVGLVIWLYVRSIQSKSQVDVQMSTKNAEAAMALVESSCGKLLWSRVEGPAQFNFKRRIWGDGENPVLSIRFEEQGDLLAASLWMSSWSTRFGAVKGGEKIQWKKSSIARKLAQLEAAAQVGISAGPQVSQLGSREASIPNAVRPDPVVTLPAPARFTTDSQLSAALNEVGSLQQRLDEGGLSLPELQSLGQEVTSRLQGVIDYYLERGGSTTLHSVVVEPMGRWALGALVPLWVMDQGATPVSAAAKQSHLEIMAFYEKYAFLEETGGQRLQP